MRFFPLTMLLLAVGPTQAWAAGFEAKTMRHPLSTQEVERSLKLPKGWLEFDLGADVKNATSYWDEDGNAVELVNADWLYTTERLDIRYGLTARSEMYFKFPFHYMRLTNDLLDTDTSDMGFGDPHVGYMYEVLNRPTPMQSLVVWVDYKGPAAKETPGTYMGGPNLVRSFVMTTGTQDLALAAGYKQAFGPAAIILKGGYNHRFGGVVQYVIETEIDQLTARIKPGDELFANVGADVQAGPMCIELFALYKQRGLTYIGVSGSDLFGLDGMDPVAESDGWSLDTQASLIFNITRGVDVTAGVTFPVRGEDLQFFPIEDIQPTRGNTYSATLKFRY